MKTKLTPLFVLFSILMVGTLVLTACGPQVVRDAEAKATEIVNNAQATAIVGTAMAEAGMSQNEPTALPSPIPQFTPTAAPTFAPTAMPTNAPAAQPADHVARLIELDKVYRASGWQAWLKAAGITCDAAVEARQPEEETVIDAAGVAHVVVSGLQVKGNCQVPYPAVVTTDRPGDVTTTAQSRTYQPDLKNPSVMYTDVDLHGQGTIWVDASNWSQMDPTK